MSDAIPLPRPVQTPSALERAFSRLQEFISESRTSMSGCGPVDLESLERQLDERTREVTLAAKAEVLDAAVVEVDVIEVQGARYRRMKDPTVGVYTTLHGDVQVQRPLYRREGVHNGMTVDALALRCGMVEGRFTPYAAIAAAELAQALPSREASKLCETLGVLPCSRSAMYRVGLSVGELWSTHRDDIEEALVDALRIPEKATNVSVAVDRVSMRVAEDRVASEEELTRGIERPVNVSLRMAYCGVWTLHDAEGRALLSTRYAHMPEEGASNLHVQLASDLEALLERRPDLGIVTLADGAPEMQRILDRVVAGLPVKAQLLDFWHFVEKLAAACKAVGDKGARVLPAWKELLLTRDTAISTIEATLKEWAQPFQGAPPEPVRAAITYIENNRDRMCYASRRAAGLPIGSGHVEATCKTIVSTRFKRPGARWRPQSAEPLLELRALATSSRWDDAMKQLAARLPTPLSQAMRSAA